MARNFILLSLERDGRVSAETRKKMHEITTNPENSAFGYQLLKTGAAQEKYAAAAAVFARLSAAAERSPLPDGVTEDEWREAGIRALGYSGASSSEAQMVFSSLKAMN